ncbi:calmin [Dasypus novemcinctus]|uniref:calmin n=1 Tax=Dasypus novemcinctus TaxID=9361 RepID=UPI00265DCA71|nr:calmin [Dasypus novemcinctus]
MAAPEWDWFQREELIGQISDIRVQNLQVERENVQKRTFTRWVNLHLEKCNPPLEVKDLFIDIQDGKILMALLEVLSGQNLLHEYKSSSHRIFRLNNIAKALKFLEDSNVKLVSIDAAEIADGNPSLVLGLIWNIILFFQIKELAGNLSRNSPSSSLSPGSGGTDSDSSFPPTPTTERSTVISLSVRDQRKAIKTLLAWVQSKTRKYGVAVQDFAGSWRSGLAFLAVIKAIDPSLVDMKQALEDTTRENLEKAFRLAHDALHIPRLLEPEDIMVDTPDEQSIVTYVAQFLEHFPELEAEDFVDSDKEFPIESTFVRIKETPPEQESQVLLLTENGECAYTINHETSHPPPSKVFVCDQPETAKDLQLQPCPGDTAGHARSGSSNELRHQIIDQVLQGSDVTESPPESSILSSRRESRRSNSLPIKKTVHFDFEDNTYRDVSCGKDSSYNQDLQFDGSPRRAKKLLKEDVLAKEMDEEKNSKEEAPKTVKVGSDEPPDAISLVGSEYSEFPTCQGPSSHNGALESTADPKEESCSPPLLGEDTVMADSLEIQVKLLTVEVMERDDFEGIPLKASKFSSDLVDFASTSHAFHEVPSPQEEKPAENDVSEECVEKLGKRKAKSARRRKDSAERSDEPQLHRGPGQEPQGPLASEEAPVGQKPEVCEKAKFKSARHRGGEDEGEAEALEGDDGDLPSTPPSCSVSLETLGSHSEEGLDFKPSPPLSKISVIPHDLFYYPHYEVPLAAVLEAYAEGAEELKNEGMDPEDPEGYLHDLDTREEEADDVRSGCSSSVTSEDLAGASSQGLYLGRDALGTHPATDPGPPAGHTDHQLGEAGESGQAPSENNQSQESPNSGNLANSVEEKVMEESISSKKKEKRKHVDHIESSIFIAPGTVRSSDDLEDDPTDHRVPCRTSHSDSSIYIRRHTNRSLESDHFSYVQLRNAADLDERRNRMLTRKASHPGEATLRESLQSDSLTQFVQQPDVMYFILFLWLLVYCLLLFPQLDINRL